MSDDKKEQLKKARADAQKKAIAKALYAVRLKNANGLILQTTDPNTLAAWDLAGAAVFIGAKWGGTRVSDLKVVKQDGAEITLTEQNSHASPPQHPDVHPDLAGAPILMSELSSMRLDFSESDKDALQKITLFFRLDSDPNKNLGLPADCILPKGRKSARLMTFSPQMTSNELVGHLQENALYYSQHIWMNFDPASLTMQFANLVYDGKRLLEYMDPTPVSATANYLVFRWNDETDANWVEWKKKNVNTNKVDVDLVALPTGGVFAEAVLGRFNSAEKLDLTRFWNWQDSPIPIQAPEIAAIQAGQREVAAVPQIGSLEAPVVSIQSPQTLPDPQGMSAILTTLAASNMFRDMSGAAAGTQLAQAALQNASQGASSAAAQAGTNLLNAGQLQIDALKAALPIVAAAAGLPLPPNLGSSNPSTAGAFINHGRNMDSRGTGASAPSSGGDPGGTSGSAPFGVAGGGAAPAAARLGANESAAFANSIPAALGTRIPLDFLHGAIAAQTPAEDVASGVSGKALVGDPDGDLDLAQIVMDHIRALEERHRGACVEASASYFADALRDIGVPMETVSSADGKAVVEFPVIGSAQGVKVSKMVLWRLWYSAHEGDTWSRLPRSCRGAGAPGALLYGDLAKGRKILTSDAGWPPEMLPGAAMQLWRSKAYYDSLRDGTAEIELGHSPVFIAYDVDDPKKITVADNVGLARVLTYPHLGLKFVMAANLSKARLVDFGR